MMNFSGLRATRKLPASVIKEITQSKAQHSKAVENTKIILDNNPDQVSAVDYTLNMTWIIAYRAVVNLSTFLTLVMLMIFGYGLSQIDIHNTSFYFHVFK